MPVHIDHPAPGMRFDPGRFVVRGWVWLAERHADVLGVEAWSGTVRLGESSEFHPRADVSAKYSLADDTRTAFEFYGRHPSARRNHQFDFQLHVRYRDGTRSEPIFSSRVGPLPLERDPQAMLRARQAEDALGLEIGAHTKPTPGLTPFYTDSVSEYTGSAGPIDFLSDARALPLADNTLDYLCSSHVLEHLPDPVAALHEWHRVLRPGGFLYLVVPDKRFTFDEPRAITPPEHVLRDFVAARTAADSADHVDEFIYQTHWHHLRPHATAEEKSVQQAAAQNEYREKIAQGLPVDIHFHTFTPESLHELLRAAGLIAGGAAHFEIVAQAERYPPDRADGIALLLKKRGDQKHRRLPSTFALTPSMGRTQALPLVCPVSLQPLHPEGDWTLATDDGCRFAIVKGRPVLLLPFETKPRRAWTSRWWRQLHLQRTRLRLAFSGSES